MNTKRKNMNFFLAVIMAALVAFSFMPMNAAMANAATADSSISVTGVETGATITGYQVVVNENGKWVAANAAVAKILSGNDAATTFEVTNNDQITSKLADLAAAADSLNVKTINLTSGSVSNPDAGSYMILVSGTTKYVYAPMLASVDYDTSNTTNTIEAKDAKKTEVDVTKKVTKKNGENVDNDHGTTDAGKVGDKVGDTLSFEITPVIPNYGKNYTVAKYVVSDALSEGLTLNQESVTVTGATSDDYTITKSASGFEIEFKQAWLLNGAAKNVTVTYTATVNEKATSGFDANTNTATIKYSTNPKSINDADLTEKDDKTYHYTFDIDGSVGGKNKKEGTEVIKVGVDANGNFIYDTEKTDLGEVTGKLAGAEFALYNASDIEEYQEDGKTKKKVKEGATPVRTATTDSNGLMKMNRLDVGTYYLVETSAPAGYVTDSTPVEVVISAELYDADSDNDTYKKGQLKSYSISIGGINTTTYTTTYDAAEVQNVNITTGGDNGDGQITAINNVKQNGLPATGGMGTVLFVVLGASIMAFAGAMFVMNRRRENA